MSGHDRQQNLDAFLGQAGWGTATCTWLAQDASTRRYARLTAPDGQTAILMDAPGIEDSACTPDMSEAQRKAAGWNASTRLAASRVDAFVLIADHLRSLGFRSPAILAHDAEQGFALIEDFGTGREFARLLERGDADETALYTQAARLLAELHRHPIPETLTKDSMVWPILTFDRLALQTNADLFSDWLPKLETRMTLTESDLAAWAQVRDDLIEQAMAFPRTFTLRDFHAENLLLLPDGQIGLLDFQDAVIGWDAWDMAMLVQDARRDVSAGARNAAISAYLDASGTSESDFMQRLAVIGTLNALRIAGVFARLQVRDGKARYSAFMPRQLRLLARNLRHPATRDMAQFVERTAPFIMELAE